MSNFIDILNQKTRDETQSIGFTQRAQTPHKAKIQLVAGLAQENAASLADRVTGADAGLVIISKATAGIETLQKVSKAQPDIHWGGWLSDSSPTKTKQLSKAGIDFMVFSSDDTPTSNENDKTGKILAVDASLNEGLLRAINELPLDAVLITEGEKQIQTINWQYLMLFRRFADLLTKPLLASVPSQVTASELKVLWDAGVRGVVMEVDPKQPADRFTKIRREIDKLDFSPPRRNNKPQVSLPHTGRETGKVTTEEDDGEEE